MRRYTIGQLKQLISDLPDDDEYEVNSGSAKMKDGSTREYYLLSSTDPDYWDVYLYHRYIEEGEADYEKPRNRT